MRPISWHLTAEQDRVLAQKKKNGPFYTGRVTTRGRTTVVVTFDDNSRARRPYNEVFYPKEMANAIMNGTSMVIFLGNGKNEK